MRCIARTHGATRIRRGRNRVLAAVEASHGAAVAVDGKMVDMPVILKARRILAGAWAAASASQRIAQREAAGRH